MSTSHGISERRAYSSRRTFSWRTVLFGHLHSHRKVFRRAEDADSAFIDWHGSWLFFLALGIMLLSCVDAFMTLQLIERGMIEVNPVMATAMGQGTAVFAISKLAMTGIGILILIGVVVNNGIVLIDHVNQLRLQGLPRDEALVRAGRERMRPILMTVGTTVLGLTPLCFGTTQIVRQNVVLKRVACFIQIEETNPASRRHSCGLKAINHRHQVHDLSADLAAPKRRTVNVHVHIAGENVCFHRLWVAPESNLRIARG